MNPNKKGITHPVTLPLHQDECGQSHTNRHIDMVFGALHTFNWSSPPPTRSCRTSFSTASGRFNHAHVGQSHLRLLRLTRERTTERAESKKMVEYFLSSRPKS